MEDFRLLLENEEITDDERLAIELQELENQITEDERLANKFQQLDEQELHKQIKEDWEKQIEEDEKMARTFLEDRHIDEWVKQIDDDDKFARELQLLLDGEENQMGDDEIFAKSLQEADEANNQMSLLQNTVLTKLSNI